MLIIWGIADLQNSLLLLSIPLELVVSIFRRSIPAEEHGLFNSAGDQTDHGLSGNAHNHKNGHSNEANPINTISGAIKDILTRGLT